MRSRGRGAVLQQQLGVAGAAHRLREDGGRQRQLVGDAALTENAAAVLTAFLQESTEFTPSRPADPRFWKMLCSTANLPLSCPETAPPHTWRRWRAEPSADRSPPATTQTLSSGANASAGGAVTPHLFVLTRRRRPSQKEKNVSGLPAERTDVQTTTHRLEPLLPGPPLLPGSPLHERSISLLPGGSSEDEEEELILVCSSPSQPGG